MYSLVTLLQTQTEELRRKLAELLARLNVTRDSATATARDRESLSKEIEELQAQLETTLNSGNSRDDVRQRRLAELAAVASTAQADWDAAEAERHAQQLREMERRIAELAEDLRAKHAAELARLEEERLRREEAARRAAEEARKIAWRAIQQRRIEEEETPGLLGRAQMMLFGGGKLKKSRPPPRIVGESVITSVVQDTSEHDASYAGRFNEDYVPSADDLARLGVQADVTSSVTQKVHGSRS